MRRLLMAAVAAAAALTLAACSGATPAPAAPSTSSSSATTSASSTTSSASASPTTSTTSPTSSGRTLDITVSGRTVTPAPDQVDLPVGQTLILVVTSDHDDQLHAHGFDVEVPLKAGVPASITLTGKDAGVFEVETHEPALTLLTVAVR
jgi:plastocyanin